MKTTIGLVLIVTFLASCGGGGGGSGTTEPPPPVSTPIPATLAITAPAGAQTATAVQFTQSSGGASDFRYAWDFGDGGQSSEASPSHTYAKGGDYDVKVVVTNGSGASRETKLQVSVNNQGFLRGLECSGAQQSGWCWISPRPTGNWRLDAFFIDAMTGWTIDVQGDFYKTTDAGASWTRKRQGSGDRFAFIRFLNAKVGIAFGNETTLLRTADGGDTWTSSTLPATLPVPVTYDDKDLILAAGDTLLISKDGGQTFSTVNWRLAALGADKSFWALRKGELFKSTDYGATETRVLDMRMPDDDSQPRPEISHFVHPMANGNAIAARRRFGSISDWFRSLDGGKSFEPFSPRGLPSGYGSGLIETPTSNTLFIGEGTQLFRSADAGSTWTQVASFEPDTTLDPRLFQLQPGTWIYSSGLDKRGLLISVDDGVTWTPFTLPPYCNAVLQAVPANLCSTGPNQYGQGFSSVRMIDSQTILAIKPDHERRTFLSRDFGKTWTQLVGQAAEQRQAKILTFHALDAQRVLSVNGNGELRASKDGGLSWQIRLGSLDLDAPPQLQFVSDKVGWMAIGKGRLYRTDDAGETWRTLPVTSDKLARFQFLNANEGFAINEDAYPHVLMQTRDGGTSWSAVGAIPALASVAAFHDVQRGIASGSGGIWETRDGGKSWVQRSDKNLSGALATYLDAKHILMINVRNAGYDSWESKDGGETWATAPGLGHQSAIHFINPLRGWVADTNGNVTMTRDGGVTWQRQQTGATYIGAVQMQFADAKTGWVLFNDGGLIATGTGGI